MLCPVLRVFTFAGRDEALIEEAVAIGWIYCKTTLWEDSGSR